MFKKKDIFKKKTIEYDIDYFVKNPIQVIYIKDNKEYKKFTLKGNYKGSGSSGNSSNDNYDLDKLYLDAENEMDRVESISSEEYIRDLYEGGNTILDIMLKKEEKTLDKYIEYSTIYPFDSILDLKQKIQIYTGIEWFKMCLFWLDDKENEYISSYILYINNLKYKINYFNLKNDNHLNKNKNNYFVKSLDEFESLKHLFMKKNMTFYILNIDDYIDRNILLNNKYEVESMYYSFVLKFFPQFTYDLFYNYIYLYDDFKSKYNNLFYINIDNLKKEHVLVNKYLKNYENKIDRLEYKYLEIHFNDEVKQFIKLRNVFEIFHINEYNINFMYMRLGNETYKKKLKKYLNFKEYKSQESLTYNYIVFYILNKYSNVPIFLKINENTQFKVSITIDYMYSLSYEEVFDYLKEMINPIVKKINKFKDILLLNNLLDELEYTDINVILSKSSLINNYSNILFNSFTNYNLIYNEMLGYPHIFSNLNRDLEDNISFNLKKGMTSFNNNYFRILHPNVNNYYSKFSLLKDMESWDNSYKGILIKLIKNQGIIQINYNLINEIDVPFAVLLVNAFISSIKLDKKREDITTKISNKKIKKLNKLKSIDPIMYSFKKSKRSKKKYSKMCQKPFHPLVYSKEEHQYIDDKTKKELVPFTNATNNEKVYYHCNNKEAPYLGFIVDEHPNNFCIPCCRVKEQNEKEFHKKCLNDFIINIDKSKKTTNLEEGNIKYILQTIENNRYSYLPLTIDLFFNKYIKQKMYKKETENKNKSSFYLFGINIFSNILKYLFSDLEEKLIILNNEANDIYDQFIQHKLKVNIIIIDRFANLNIEQIFDYDIYIILYEINEKSYYPIIEFITDGGENTKIKKYYTKNDKLIILLNEIINLSNTVNDDTNKWTFGYIEKHFEIKSVLINNRNLIYGAIIQDKKLSNNLILYPIDYYYNNTKYSTFNLINNNYLKNVTEKNVVAFLLKNKLKDEIKYYIKDNENYYFAIKLRNKKFFYFNQTKDKTLTDTFDKYIHFPLYLISEKILKNEIEFSMPSLDYNIYYIYYKNLYKLILQEITYHFLTKKNTEKRNLLTNIYYTYKDYNVFYKQIIANFKEENEFKLLNLFNLLKNIEHLTKNNINELLNKIRFNFDDEKKNEYMNNPTYKGINDLLEEVCLFIPQKELSLQVNKEILKNILLPCVLEKNNYCKNNKLLVPKEEKNNLISLIINDLQNPIRKNIIFSIKMIIDDPYQFNILPHEEIIIS